MDRWVTGHRVMMRKNIYSPTHLLTYSSTGKLIRSQRFNRIEATSLESGYETCANADEEGGAEGDEGRALLKLVRQAEGAGDDAG